jgi:hypothetical protein
VTGKRERDANERTPPADDMANDRQEAARFPIDTEIMAMKPGEWLDKFVGAGWTPAQLLAITSAQESWCNTFFGNSAASSLSSVVVTIVAAVVVRRRRRSPWLSSSSSVVAVGRRSCRRRRRPPSSSVIVAVVVVVVRRRHRSA